MIKIDQPSMALNSHDVPGAEYKMWNTWKVPADDNPTHILGWCATVASAASGGKLRCLIFNCHGIYNNMKRSGTGGFGMSIGTGIRRADTGKFSVLNGKVEKILLVSCGVARITIPGTIGDGDGNLFCSEIAKAAGAYVIAPTTAQAADFWLPRGYIDDWEGLVLCYNPSGGVDWSKNYTRGLLDGIVNGWN